MDEGTEVDRSSSDGDRRVTRLPLMIMAALIVLAVLVTIVLASNERSRSYPEGSPEAVLQRFVSAAIDDDEDTMLDLLVSEHRNRCVAALRNDVFADPWPGSDIRADLDDLVIEGNSARATVRFTENSGSGPFDDGAWDYGRRFTLVNTDGGWLIDRAGWPWVFAECTS